MSVTSNAGKVRLSQAASTNSPSPLPPSPSPPSPPPPFAPALHVPFPFCECNHTMYNETSKSGLVPFKFGRDLVIKRSGSNRLYCTRLYATACVDPWSPCCTQNLAKIEWWSKDTCRGSVKAVYMDGVRMDQQWAPQGTFKIPALNIARYDIAPAGREVCMELISTSSCPTLSSFCYRGDRGQCFYSAFSTDKACCPVGTFNSTMAAR
ncbi:hypothetical protein HYH03_007551 [Edaphochlamys debaryana]|uniref:Pherophorin domain-containing protein n=1 Tax=Edaphochlamys debaryana TaxID=47281 RepID=A0A835Y1I2_9CHLO|nr:hypothetical protein HYH03_007551 [Edaphochlamys debaryana]|eukprot:KAG2494193.1 hypothetical protein HYH03_007551 [Edaphochlamys debaryana]